MKTNKKTFRKIAGAATAAVLATCAIAPISVTNVSAASITITNSQADHTYEAYQIFKGDLVDGKLSKIEWGDGVNSTKIFDAVTALTPFSGCLTAADVAEKLATYTNKDDPDVVAFAEVVAKNLGSQTPYTPNVSTVDGTTTYTIDLGNKPGYYLIKDKDNSLDGEHATYTNYIVEVLGSQNVTAKSGLPQLEKKVKDINDSTGVATDYQDTADYDIGDLVPFQLTATVDTKLADYDGYSFVIHDTLSNGLKLKADTIKVQAFDNAEDTSGVDVAYTKTDTTGGFDIQISNLEDITDVKAGGLIVVTYEAYLGGENKVNAGDVVIGSTGNPNTASLEYSNNPNDSNKTGKTPDDTVIVYTYQTIINKKNDASPSAPLSGATFELKKMNSDGTWSNAIAQVETGETSTFTFQGLDDGKYMLTETSAPKGYNKLKDSIYFEIEAEHTNDPETLKLKTLTGTQKKLDSDNKTFVEFNGEATSFGSDLTAGSLTASVQNKSGSTLPSTGGIGTTPFYVGGGVLVAAAGVYIIVKKRMKNNDEEK